MLNWNQIHQEYPLAFQKWWDSEKYHDPSGALQRFLSADPIDQNEEWMKVRDLYDFFDEAGLPLEVHNSIDIFGDGSYYANGRFEYNIYPGKKLSKENMKDYASRKEAERAAFTDAFRILNQQLAA